MIIRIILLSLLVFWGCSGDDVNKPMSQKKLNPPPRTAARTWIASGKEAELTSTFLGRYSDKDAAWFREMLLRSDAKVETPNDPEGQKLLDQIYAERWKANEAIVNQKKPGK